MWVPARELRVFKGPELRERVIGYSGFEGFGIRRIGDPGFRDSANSGFWFSGLRDQSDQKTSEYRVPQHVGMAFSSIRGRTIVDREGSAIYSPG